MSAFEDFVSSKPCLPVDGVGIWDAAVKAAQVCCEDLAASAWSDAQHATSEENRDRAIRRFDAVCACKSQISCLLTTWGAQHV
jgi:hypothetical protein